MFLNLVTQCLHLVSSLLSFSGMFLTRFWNSGHKCFRHVTILSLQDPKNDGPFCEKLLSLLPENPLRVGKNYPKSMA